MTRQHWLFVGIAGSLVVLVAVQPQDRRQYIAHPPPDTVAYQPVKLDSVSRAVFRCFGKQATVRWFVTDSALGVSDSNGKLEPAAGRYFPRYRAIAFRRGYENDPALVDHELRHAVTGRLDHPEAVFQREC